MDNPEIQVSKMMSNTDRTNQDILKAQAIR